MTLLGRPVAALAARFRELQAPEEATPPRGLLAELRPYQLRGLSWPAAMCGTGLGGCLADDMGLGKTLQTIALHLARAGGPMLVVCPASLLGNWERELSRFAPGLTVRRYHGGERHLDDLDPQEVVLVTYGVVRRDRAQLAAIAWDLVVADEAQHVKNPLSRTARELRGIGSTARGADRDPRGEPALRSLVAPRLDHPGAAGVAGRLPPAGRHPGRGLRGRRGARPSGPGGAALPAAPPQDRSRHRPGAPAQDRDRPDRAADRRAGDAVRGGGARVAGGDPPQPGHGPPRHGAQAADSPQADLQPPRPLSASGRSAARAIGQAGGAGRAAAGDRRGGGERPRLHPVRGHGTAARGPPARSRHRQPAAPGRGAGAQARRDGRGLPGG